MARFRSLILAALLSTVFVQNAAALQGKLDQVRTAVDRGDDGGHEKREHSWPGEEVSPTHELEGHLFAALIRVLAYLPVALPREALRDSGVSWGDFSGAPYERAGGFWIDRNEQLAWAESGRPPETAGRSWSFRLGLDHGSDFDGLERSGARLLAEHANRLGFDLSWNHWVEDVRGGGTDELGLADANVFVRFAQSEYAAFRAGLGLNALDDHGDWDLGFNMTYAADFLPVRPWVLSLELDTGTLGESWLWHLRGVVGAMLGQVELGLSYDWYRIQEAELRSLGLGMTVWL